MKRLALTQNSHIKKHKKYLDYRINELYDYVSSSPETEIVRHIVEFLTGVIELTESSFPSHVLQPLEETKSLIDRWDILNDGDIVGYIYEQIQSRKHKKFKGQFFTQEEMVDIIVSKSLQCIDKDEISVLDPACGSGQFLITAIRHLSIRPGLSLQKITSRLIHGFDIDPIAVSIARYNLSRISGCDSTEINVHCADFLRKDDLNLCTGHRCRQSFDLVTGNPPWEAPLSIKIKSTISITISLPTRELILSRYLWKEHSIT